MADYIKAVANATTLYKLIDRLAPEYEKFALFTQIIGSLASKSHPPSVI